ncbi:MAG: hypothetical protein JWO04_1454 [Gammaproteobacteria bacterium]|nr:hypothetical protein [Gammaproteobacteria bacterium]
MLVKRAYKVQIPCHRKFQCSFHGLRAEAPSWCTILALLLKALRQMGAKNSEVDHMNGSRIDEIARRLFESVPPGVRAIQKDLESNFRAVLRASLTKLDLVSRDEFEAQMRVLERTRGRLEELERRVAGMESGDGVPGSGSAAGGGITAGGGGTAGSGAAGAGGAVGAHDTTRASGTAGAGAAGGVGGTAERTGAVETGGAPQGGRGSAADRGTGGGGAPGTTSKSGPH